MVEKQTCDTKTIKPLLVKCPRSISNMTFYSATKLKKFETNTALMNKQVLVLSYQHQGIFLLSLNMGFPLRRNLEGEVVLISTLESGTLHTRTVFYSVFFCLTMYIKASMRKLSCFNRWHVIQLETKATTNK